MVIGMRLFDRAVDVIFPRRCPICDDAVDTVGELICRECQSRVKIIREPYCMKCGKPVISDAQRICRDCETTQHSFNRGRAAFCYDETMKDSIYRFKYGRRKEYADYYSNQMVMLMKDQLKSWQPDALIPIPIHKKRFKQRGYNQAQLLAERIAGDTGIPMRADILLRDEDTKVQKNLTAADRQNNLKKALKIGVDVVKLKNIVIVDDIYTTGSTIDAAASILHDAGVENIYFMVLCSGDIS